jgi:hypothetical protein
MVDETIDRRQGHGLIREDFSPFAERLIGGDKHRSSFLACADQFEQNAGLRLILGHIATEMLHSDGGVLGLGARAESEFGRRHFGDLVVSFSSPMLLSVMFGRTELGSVHPLALAPPRDGEPNVILLAGRSWRVMHVDWPRRRVSVIPAPGEGRARWLGGGRPASYALCRSAEAVVGGADSGCELSRRAASKLEQIREQLSFAEGTKIPLFTTGRTISASGPSVVASRVQHWPMPCQVRPRAQTIFVFRLRRETLQRLWMLFLK